jgi:hypothetical protein
MDEQGTGDIEGCPRHESNMRTRFRKPLLYPLSYGGVNQICRTFSDPAASECIRGQLQVAVDVVHNAVLGAKPRSFFVREPRG